MMSKWSARRWAIALALSVVGVLNTASMCSAEMLVADRLTNSVYRYSTSGTFLGTLLTDNVNLNQPSGLVVSPDLQYLYVSSSQNDQIVRYDYNYAAGTATNATVFATAAQGLNFPNDMVFSADGQTLYVAGLNNLGISQLDAATGANVGPNISGGSSFSFSGLEWGPNGQLLAAGFDGGTVAISNSGITSLSDLVAPNALIQGAAGLLVDGDYVYVTGLFTGQLNRFDITTGEIDPTFNVSGLAFPQGIIKAPDGNGLLVGILGFVNGQGNISRYSEDGTFLEVFADNGIGFVEATSFVVVPEASPLLLAGVAVAAVCVAVKFRRRPETTLAS